ncbi:hypothetical protein EVAR_31170_1 [Eumeta japonica]|uniref:Uncharacterized protein n=1 Tax=Eumeta variegata TaxID=151549 RepID=A0A4C1VVM5_EUMVA|nr:hypothetical protein EVAR_31170_1 [Eumeta japonica]
MRYEIWCRSDVTGRVIDEVTVIVSPLRANESCVMKNDRCRPPATARPRRHRGRAARARRTARFSIMIGLMSPTCIVYVNLKFYRRKAIRNEAFMNDKISRDRLTAALSAFLKLSTATRRDPNNGALLVAGRDLRDPRRSGIEKTTVIQRRR